MQNWQHKVVNFHSIIILSDSWESISTFWNAPNTAVNSAMDQVNEFDQAIVFQHYIYIYQDAQPMTKEFPHKTSQYKWRPKQSNNHSALTKTSLTRPHFLHQLHVVISWSGLRLSGSGEVAVITSGDWSCIFLTIRYKLPDSCTNLLMCSNIGISQSCLGHWYAGLK